MARWFRFYSDAMRHPKVAKLSDKDFRLWCDLLCVASDRDGAIPCLDDLKHVLKRRLDHLSTGVERLISAGLIEPLGCGYAPHGWSEKQYKSDVSTDRVKRHREKRNVSETAPETEVDTETDAETDIKEPYGSSASGDALKPEHVSEKWNEIAGAIGRPRIRDLTPERRQLVRARIAQYSIDDFIAVFGKVAASPFLRGDRNWRGATFDWVMKKANFQKILEGNYDD